MKTHELIPGYENSWALVVGIDDYRGALPPLNTAAKGATGLANVLEETLGFDPDHIILLTDGDATQRNIRRALTDPFSRPDKVGPNDRVLIYFAGHGITFDTAEGEIGCIAPADAEPGYIDTAIPMDELTRLANRIHAKHVLFLLDACFSGFATTRDASAGVERQVADFMTRPARQVITAGTREQAVSDYWGPGGHSLFTGFVIEGLRGSAPSPAGVTRAFHLAGYLQDQVAQHSRSLQTPQYAALIGSQGGDFIFAVRPVGELSPAVLHAAASDDPAQRLLAVGRLRALARNRDNEEQAAHALARLEEIADADDDVMVRSSARAALSELIPLTHVAPIVREELAEAGARPRGEGPPAGAAAPAPPPGPQRAPMGELSISDGPRAGQRISLTELPLTIGRTPGNMLVLDDSKVSRHHALIEQRGEALWIVDRGSTNGTTVNGQPLVRARQLHPGDAIGIGQSRLVFARPSAPPQPAEAPVAPQDWQTPHTGPATGTAGTMPEASLDDEARKKKRRTRIFVLVAAGFALCTLLTCLISSLSTY